MRKEVLNILANFKNEYKVSFLSVFNGINKIDFCSWIESLPYSELITGKVE